MPEELPQRELRHKTRCLTAAFLATTVAGNFFLSEGMHEVGHTVTWSVSQYLAALLNPWVIGGVAVLILWLISQLSLLSWADLSFVLPVTSLAYVIAAIVGRVVMNDRVPPLHWIGIVLIMAGAIIVGRTMPRTTPEHEQDFIEEEVEAE